MILNARSRAFIEDDHAASLDGTGGTDTHYAELEGMDGRTAGLEGTQGPDPMLVGESGLTAMLQGTESADTRMAVLAGGVTDDHAAALEGDGPVIGINTGSTIGTGTDAAAGLSVPHDANTIQPGTWMNVGYYEVGPTPAGSGLILEAVHMVYFVQNRVPMEYRFVDFFDNSRVVGSGSFEVDSDEVIHPVVFSAYDHDPANTYRLQIRPMADGSGESTTIWTGRYAHIYTVVNPGTDTHAAMLQGEASVGDTHEAVLQGPTANTAAPLLIGSRGVDTHVAVLQGTPPVPSFGTTGSVGSTPFTVGTTGPLLTIVLPRSTSTSVLVTDSTSGVRGNIAIVTYQAGTTSYAWSVFRESTLIDNGTIRSFFAGGLIVVTFQDQPPDTGTITYTVTIQGFGPTRICSAAISATTLSVTDDHAAVVTGNGPVDGHTAAMEGGITEDTHTVMLEGEDTHDVIFDGDADTHAAVFEGEDTVKAALRGGEGDDTHQAVLSGSSRAVRRGGGNGSIIIGGYDE